MRSTATALLLTTAATFSHALPELSLQKRDRHTNGRTQDVAHGIMARDGTLGTTVFDIETYSAGGAYYVNITVGTPPQPQTVILDTGSSDLYFDASTSAACESTGSTSCKGGDFDLSKSSTYKQVEASPAFNTSFGDGSTAYGPYGVDTITISDVELTDVQFGVATTVDITTGFALGLMGVGYSAGEATNTQYPNMPEVLVDAGVINSRLYSVYLNDAEALSGSILFGGIDTAKYTGPLQIVDILPDLSARGLVDRFITTITGLSLSADGSSQTIFAGGIPGVDAYRPNSGSLPVLLDTGSAAWSVSSQLYEVIVRNFPYVNPKQGVAPCSNRYNSDTLTVTFNAAINITVPMSDLLVPLFNSSTNQPQTFSNGQPACVFMITPSGPTGLGFQPVGDSILRSMYIVYDLDNGQMGLAQANVNSTSTNIRTVAAGPSGIAKAANNVKTVAANNFSIAATASPTGQFGASTGRTTVGGATGTAAIPAGAQSGASTSTSKSDASGVLLPLVDWSGAYTSGIALVMAAFGAAMML